MKNKSQSPCRFIVFCWYFLKVGSRRGRFRGAIFGSVWAVNCEAVGYEAGLVPPCGIAGCSVIDWFSGRVAGTGANRDADKTLSVCPARDMLPAD